MSFENVSDKFVWEGNGWHWPSILYVAFFHAGALLPFFVPGTFTWPAVLTGIVLLVLTGGVGVSVGLHRYYTHGTFEIKEKHKWFRRTLATLAAMEAHSAIPWIAHHELHHKYCGTKYEPHNHTRGGKYLGLLWAHIGWFLTNKPEGWDPRIMPRARKAAEDPYLRFIQDYLLLFPLGTLLLLYLIGGLPFLIWAGFIRMVAVGHLIWSINSLSHFVGTVRYHDEKGGSRNMKWLTWLTMGEGLHNNHHARSKTANFAADSSEFDPMWYVILLFKKLGVIGWVNDHDGRRP